MDIPVKTLHNFIHNRWISSPLFIFFCKAFKNYLLPVDNFVCYDIDHFDRIHRCMQLAIIKNRKILIKFGEDILALISVKHVTEIKLPNLVCFPLFQ